MRAPFSLSCLFLLSLGACIPPGERREPAHGGEGTLLGARWRAAADAGAGWRAGAQRRRSEELEALLGIPRELRGYGSEGTGQRPGRRGVLPTAGEKRSGTLGNLAEELSGYNRRKGGFTFRFGR
ncbi:OX26 protein, partial [Sclerurus mexicanus]|nr:OX26 protein [Sclerurus mexicanus]